LYALADIKIKNKNQKYEKEMKSKQYISSILIKIRT